MSTTIYLLTFPNGKVYVGQTTQKLRDRVRKHATTARDETRREPIYEGWREHGPPTVEALLVCEDDQGDDYEVALIRLHNARTPHGYNAQGGGKGKGREISDQTKARISAGRKAAWARMTPEQRKSALEGRFGAVDQAWGRKGAASRWSKADLPMDEKSVARRKRRADAERRRRNNRSNR